MSGRVLCSTGALIGRPNGRNHRLLESFAPELDCGGFEFMIYDTWYPKLDEVVSDVRAMGLNIPTVHCEKGIGELLATGREDEAVSAFRLNCSAAERLGAKLLVLHLWNGVVSDSNIAANFAGYRLLGPISKEFGLTLTVENVVCNRSDPMTHLRELLEYGAVFTFDTKMAAFHGQLMELFEPLNRGVLESVRHLHINDYGGACMDWKSLRTQHIGEGKIDFEKFFEKFPDDYRGDYTVESTAFLPDGTVDLAKLNADLRKVKALAAKKHCQT